MVSRPVAEVKDEFCQVVERGQIRKVEEMKQIRASRHTQHAPNNWIHADRDSRLRHNFRPVIRDRSAAAENRAQLLE